MRGAIAAGHPLTAEAGARVLAEGGNAVDACIAAGFASWVVESTLTAPGAGGFMLVHRAGESGARLLDFFAARPGKGLPAGQSPAMESVDIDYDGSGSEVFHIGAASCAVPGTVAGLAAAHRAYATLPWPELIAPAVELARGGFELIGAQAYLHRIVDLILRHTDEGRIVYGRDGERLVAGERLALPDLAATLERLAGHGADDFYRGELARQLSGHVLEQGGLLTLEDLRDYRVVRRRPIRVGYLGHEFISNPPPSSGGVLIGYGLQLLERLGPPGPPGSAGALAQLAEVMRETTRARGGRFATDLHRGGAAGRLYSEASLSAAEARVRARLPGLVEAAAQGTTHISVVDGRGNAASMTTSNGAGSGIIVPGTGVHLNNMLGEHDLNRPGSGALPGRRLTSMMAPSIVLRDGRPRLVVGSAGSVRLRNAILQIVVNVLRDGDGVREAIERPRIHLQVPHVHCEGGHDPAALDALEALGYDVVRWRRLNLYFGGAAGVEFLEDGSLTAAGDPRRGGHGIVVE